LNGDDIDDKFGSSTAINKQGTRMAVGIPNNKENGINSGKVIIYDWNGTSWNQVGNALLGNYNEMLGSSLAMNGDGSILFVGLPTMNGFLGAVRAYQLNGSTWQQMGIDMTYNDTASNGLERAGNAYPITSSHPYAKNADDIAIANPLITPNTSTPVHMYYWPGFVENNLQTITFGFSIDCNDSGTRVVIGCPASGKTNLGYTGSSVDFVRDQNGVGGIVRTYEWNGTAWLQLGHELGFGRVDTSYKDGYHKGFQGFERFGYQVSMNDDGERFIVGVGPRLNTDKFTRPFTVHELVTSNSSVTVDGQTITPGNGTIDISGNGFIYKYKYLDTWVSIDTFGYSHYDGHSYENIENSGHESANGMDVLGFSVAINGSGNRFVASGKKGFAGSGTVSLTIEMKGGGGGSGSRNTNSGGQGTLVQGTIRVPYNGTLYLNVGGYGESAANTESSNNQSSGSGMYGGYNGGGLGGLNTRKDRGGGGGGGASSIAFVTGTLETIGSSQKEQIIAVAGGGGGGASGSGGAHGGSNSDGFSATNNTNPENGLGGKAGTTTIGGIGSQYVNNDLGDGGFGKGGNGLLLTNDANPHVGGGGGGGLYGGGSGTRSDDGYRGAGGGGSGSSWINPTHGTVTNITGNTTEISPEHGYIKITQNNQTFTYNYTGSVATIAVVDGVISQTEQPSEIQSLQPIIYEVDNTPSFTTHPNYIQDDNDQSEYFYYLWRKLSIYRHGSNTLNDPLHKNIYGNVLSAYSGHTAIDNAGSIFAVANDDTIYIRELVEPSFSNETLLSVSLTGHENQLNANQNQFIYLRINNSHFPRLQGGTIKFAVQGNKESYANLIVDKINFTEIQNAVLNHSERTTNLNDTLIRVYADGGGFIDVSGSNPYVVDLSSNGVIGHHLNYSLANPNNNDIYYFVKTENGAKFTVGELHWKY